MADDIAAVPAAAGAGHLVSRLLTRSPAQWVNTFIQWITSIHMYLIP